MIVEPFEPISEPRVCGWPHHGFLAVKQVGGYLNYDYSLFINGEEIALPSDFTDVPYGRRSSFKIKHPDVRPVDLTPDEIVSEAENHRSWKDFATVSGVNSVFYGNQLGPRSWIAILPDNRAWKVKIEPSFNGASYEWRMVFSRYAYGPVYREGQAIGYRWFSIRLINNSEYNGYFNAYTAEHNTDSMYTLADLSIHGRTAFLTGGNYSVGGTTTSSDLFPIRLPSAADFIAMGVDITTASGTTSASFDPVVDNQYDSRLSTVHVVSEGLAGGSFLSYDLETDYFVKTPMFSFKRSLSKASLSRINALQAESTGVSRVYAVDGSALNGNVFYVDYRVFDIPEIALEWDIVLERKAHVSQGSDESFVLYKSETKVVSKINPSGVLSIAGFYSGGGYSPKTDLCPPPDTASCPGTIYVRNSVEYGQNKWVSANAFDIDINTGDQKMVNYYSLRSLNSEVWNPALPLNNATDKLMNPFQLFFSCPETPVTLDDYMSFATYDYNASITEHRVSDGASEFLNPLMHFVNRSGIYQPYLSPILGVIPKGTYYKGELITGWLPSSAYTWSYDYSTGDIIKLLKPATYSSDGYVFVTYV